MRSADFFVPGLIAVILILISTLLTSIAIVREKESGTMEQILVSPIGRDRSSWARSFPTPR